MGSQDPFVDCHTGENRRKGARKETRGGEGRPGRGRRKKEREKEWLPGKVGLSTLFPPIPRTSFISFSQIRQWEGRAAGSRAREKRLSPPGAQRPFLRLGAMASGTLQAPSHPKGPPVAVRASSCTGVSVCFRKENRPFTQPYPRRRPRSRGDDPTPVPRGRGRLGRGGHKYLCSSLCPP